MTTIPQPFVYRHSPEEIAERVDALARRLDARLRGQELLVVGILKGSAVFLADLVRRLAPPVRFEFIDVARTDEPDPAGEPRIALRFFRHFPIAGAHVLVLRDVVTTGVIETYLLAQLRAQGPRSLALATVIDRPSARRISFEVDDALFLEPDDELWVGYGLDNGDGLLAHLPGLAVLPRN